MTTPRPAVRSSSARAPPRSPWAAAAGTATAAILGRLGGTGAGADERHPGRRRQDLRGPQDRGDAAGTGRVQGLLGGLTHRTASCRMCGTSSIDCACHGSRFSITDGAVEQGPATGAAAGGADRGGRRFGPAGVSRPRTLGHGTRDPGTRPPFTPVSWVRAPSVWRRRTATPTAGACSSLRPSCSGASRSRRRT